MKDTVFILADAPRLGMVATASSARRDAIAALRSYRQTLSTTLRLLAADRRFHTIIAATPDHACHGQPNWACGVPVVPQGRGDRGQRIQRIARHFARGRIAFLTGGIPGVTAADVVHGFRMLGQAHACFGPTVDGNAWLVALSPRRPSAPFALVRWASDWALEDILANFVGRQVALLRELPAVGPPAASDQRRRAA